MVIALNAKSLSKDSEAGGEFIFETFSRITKQNPQHTFIFIFDGQYDPALIFSGNIKPVVVSDFPKKPLLWRIWYDYKIPRVLKQYKADVFVSTGICSLRTRVPQCMIVDDLSFLNFPQFILKSHFNFYKKNTPKYLKKAKVIVTLSESCKNDIIAKYKIEAGKMDVVYSGVNEIVAPVNFGVRENTKEKYAEGNEYFAFTGEITPKNNLVNLLKAFSFFKKRQKSNMQLLICGLFGFKQEEFTESLRLFKFKNDVKVYSNLTGGQLAKIIASAYAVVYPSFFQGFDLAMMQAMKSEVPLIAGDIKVMIEMCGEAALYANPNDHKMIAEKMMLVFKDEELRKHLIEKGKHQVQKYNWDNAASLLLGSIIKTIE